MVHANIRTFWIYGRHLAVTQDAELVKLSVLNNNARELTRETRKVIGLQLVIGGLTAAGFFVAKDLWHAQSALYGGLISVFGTYMLARRVERAGEIAQQNPKKSMQLLYIGAVQRFVLVAALLGCGLLLIKLEPVALIAGLVLTQLGYIMGMHAAKRAD